MVGFKPTDSGVAARCVHQTSPHAQIFGIHNISKNFAPPSTKKPPLFYGQEVGVIYVDTTYVVGCFLRYPYSPSSCIYRFKVGAIPTCSNDTGEVK